jgi:hypothetical protein
MKRIALMFYLLFTQIFSIMMEEFILIAIKGSDLNAKE